MTHPSLFILHMIQQQSTLIEDPYLQHADWIQLEFENFSLYAEGFKSPQVTMRATNDSSLFTLFIIEHAHQSKKANKKSIHFSEPIVLIHRLSRKYLCYGGSFGNKSGLRLRSSLTSQCQFILKPLYKCQTIRGSQVRNKEQCALSPAAPQYVAENVNLVVAKQQKSTLSKTAIHLKKNQHSPLRITRKNLTGKTHEDISNLMIYQIGHFELKKWICCQQAEGNKDSIALSSASGAYSNLLVIEIHGQEAREEVRIQEKDEIGLKFLGVGKYLGFNESGFFLSKEKTFDTSFQIELYSKKSLNTNSLVKIKHTQTKKYLSFQNDAPLLSTFTTFNIYEINALSPECLITNFFIHQTYHALLKQFNGSNNPKRKRAIASLLKQIIKFIYKNKNIYEEFLALQSIKPHITQQQQSLFGQVGFVTLLKDISVAYFEEYQRSILEKIQERKYISNEYYEQEEIYVQTCIILGGICKNHKQNIILFSQLLQAYVQHIGKIKANIELLYHIYAFSSSGLCVLQGLKFVIKKQEMKGFQFCCQYLYKKEFSTQSRIKLTKLLHGCLVNQKQQKMHSHQEVLLEVVHQNRLNNILLSLSNNEEYDLIVSLKGSKEQLSSMLEKEQYEKELNLLFEQIDLLITLCSRTSKRHFYLFRDIISEETLKKYIKLPLIPRFKSLFLKILIKVYLSTNRNVDSHSLIVITNPKKKGFDETAPFRKLSNLSALTNSLLNKEEVEMEEVNESQFKYMINMSSLGQINELIKRIIHNKLQKGQIGSQIVFCLYAFCNFLEVGVCQQNEGQQVLGQLGSFLSRCYREKRELDLQLVDKFLELLQHNVKEKIKLKVNSLFLKVRESYREGEQKGKYSKKIIALCNQFMERELNIVNPLFFTLLHTIINYSASLSNYPIFFTASKLYHKISRISYYFLQMVKKSIPIESDDSHITLRKINKIYNALCDGTVNYIYYHDNSVEIQSLRKNIVYIISEAIELLDNIEEDEPINLLSQKIMGQFNFFDIVIELIYQRQKDLLRGENDELFQLLFKFIAMFLFNSQENLLKSIKQLNKLQVVFKYSDKGQIKLLWTLTQMKAFAARMNPFLFNSWISAAKSATYPNIHIPLGILKLIKKKELEQNNDQNTSGLIGQILGEKSILDCLLKINSEKDILGSGEMKSKQEWIFYLSLVMKLLLMVLHQSKQHKTSLLNCYRKYFPLKLLISLIEESFALEFDRPSKQQNLILLIALKLIKIELINMFSTLYLVGHNTQFEYLIYLCQRIFMRVGVENVQCLGSEYIYKHFIFYNKGSESMESLHLRQGIMSYLKIQNDNHFEIPLEVFHQYVANIYLFINHYYHFIFKMYASISEANLNRQAPYTLTAIKQLELLISTVFNTYKEIIQEKLTYSEYVSHWSTYSVAVKSTEEILNKKAGLSFNYQSNDQPITLIEGQQYFCSAQVEFILKSFQHKKARLQKYLYESILIMIYNPHIQHPKGSQRPAFNDKRQLMHLMVNNINSQHDFEQNCKLICCYAVNNHSLPEWQPTLEQPQILRRIAINSQEVNISMLKFYMFTELSLLQNYYQFQQNQFLRYNPRQFNNSSEFTLHFCKIKDKLRSLIQMEVRLHERKMLLQQSQYYFQFKLTNYQMYPTTLSIELILEWVLYKLKYSVSNIDRYYDVILQVVNLLKTYAHFIHKFDRIYISSELYKKIELCLKILFRSVTGNNVKMMMVLIQQQIWTQINLLLSLNDSLEINLEQIHLNAYDLIKRLTRFKLQSLPATYLQGVLQLFNNSKAIYGQNGEIVDFNRYPLIPARSFYHHIKYLVAILIKQFKHLPNNISVQFYSKIDIKYIDYNISNSYQKFDYMYGKYSIATLYPALNYKGKKQIAIAQSIGIDSGVQFAAIRMHIESLNGHYELANKYSQYRLQANRYQKVQSFFSTIQYFFTDLIMLIVGIFYSYAGKSKGKPKFETAILFFLTKLSHIQLIFQNEIYEQDFMVYPECVPTTKSKKKFLNKINFISNQLKRESILLEIQRFVLNYQNQLAFFKKFNKVKLMLFMGKYIEVLKLISYAIVVVNNIILLMNDINVTNQTLIFSTPFQILTAANFLDSLLILLIYIIKEMPFVLKIQQYNLTQGIGYFGRKFNEKSAARKNFVLFLMVITNRRLIYNILYAAVVGLIFYNPVFASVLLLDVLAHVPSLKTLLLAIWRPKYHLILTMIAYIILQYFFSILMYFFFKSQANLFCESLGSCFEFIFFTTFKAVHGFVGYLFQENQEQDLSANVKMTSFLLFQNVYVVMIYQIVIALILAIVIDSFTVARTEKLKQMDNLTSACIICNIERSKFNIQSKLGFKGHVSVNHNLFSYIDFKYAVTAKPYDYLTDFQLAVLADKTSSWIPDSRTKDFEQPLFINNKTIDEK